MFVPIFMYLYTQGHNKENAKSPATDNASAVQIPHLGLLKVRLSIYKPILCLNLTVAKPVLKTYS